jgi:hypothetical protein
MRRLIVTSVLAAFLGVLAGCGDSDKKAVVPEKDKAAPKQSEKDQKKSAE